MGIVNTDEYNCDNFSFMTRLKWREPIARPEGHEMKRVTQITIGLALFVCVCVFARKYIASSASN